MSAIVCPTITPISADPHEFREQLERVSFAPRVQIDLMDGRFAPNKNLNPIQVWWTEGMLADIHLMYEKPAEHIETLVSLQPHMVILHAEAEGDIAGFIRHIQRFGIRAGVALLPETSIASVYDCIEVADHVLIFSGTLGQFGGTTQLEYLEKIPEIRAIKPAIEIGWDGGVNTTNIAQLAEGGVDVLNVGGAIQNADEPQAAYEELCNHVS